MARGARASIGGGRSKETSHVCHRTRAPRATWGAQRVVLVVLGSIVVRDPRFAPLFA
jgi:hypothetical protein